ESCVGPDGETPRGVRADIRARAGRERGARSGAVRRRATFRVLVGRPATAPARFERRERRRDLSLVAARFRGAEALDHRLAVLAGAALVALPEPLVGGALPLLAPLARLEPQQDPLRHSLRQLREE